MTTLKYLICTLLLLSTVGCYSQTPDPHEIKIAAFRATTETLQINDQKQKAFCTATHIGPNALLTATHCEVPSDVILVRPENTPRNIVGRIRDGQDHTIYLVDGPAFQYVTKVAFNEIKLTDEVFTFGFPGKFGLVYEQGTFSSVYVDDDNGVQQLLFDMRDYSGFSGAGIFRATDGAQIGVISYYLIEVDEKEKDQHIQFTSAQPMDFKPEDVVRAQNFAPLQKENSDGNKPSPTAPANKQQPANQ